MPVPGTSPRFQRVLGGGVASSREDVLDEYGTNMGTIGQSRYASVWVFFFNGENA